MDHKCLFIGRLGIIAAFLFAAKNVVAAGPNSSNTLLNGAIASVEGRRQSQEINQQSPEQKSAAQTAPATATSATTTGAPATVTSATTSTPTAPAVSAAKPAGTATLEGVVPVRPLKVATGTKEKYGARTTTVVDPPDPPTSVVWMVGSFPPLDSKSVPIAKAPAMDQRGFQFRPCVMAVQTGTPVSFPNKDPMYHSVFSYSAARKFDLGRYRAGEEPDAVVFDKPGTVSLFCEIHEHMRAQIVVVDTPFFVVTDAKGNFTLPNLPAGSHTFHVWLGPKESFEMTVDLKEGATAKVDWSNQAPGGAKPE
jgi:plastocyanin